MVDFNYLFETMGKELARIYDNPLVFGVIILFLLFSSYTDLKYLKIYNKSNLAFLMVRIIFIFIPVFNLNFNIQTIIGGILGAGFLMVPAMKLMYNMGGDIKLLGVLGLYLGGYNITLLLALSCITMLLFSLIRKIITKKELKNLDTPFAPFFTVSFLIMGLIHIYVF